MDTAAALGTGDGGDRRVITEIWRWCECVGFVLWYVGEDNARTRYCRCGHSDEEHLDGTRSCVGDVIVRK